MCSLSQHTSTKLGYGPAPSEKKAGAGAARSMLRSYTGIIPPTVPPSQVSAAVGQAVSDWAATSCRGKAHADKEFGTGKRTPPHQ